MKERRSIRKIKVNKSRVGSTKLIIKVLLLCYMLVIVVI
jgi:hypothetical protein